jgi:hypothetical protein
MLPADSLLPLSTDKEGPLPPVVPPGSTSSMPFLSRRPAREYDLKFAALWQRMFVFQIDDHVSLWEPDVFLCTPIQSLLSTIHFPLSTFYLAMACLGCHPFTCRISNRPDHEPRAEAILYGATSMIGYQCWWGHVVPTGYQTASNYGLFYFDHIVYPLSTFSTFHSTLHSPLSTFHSHFPLSTLHYYTIFGFF